MNTESLRQKAIEAKALAEKATSGPWINQPPGVVQKREGNGPIIFWDDKPNVDDPSTDFHPNYKFIAASRELVPILAEAVLQLLSEREKMIEGLLKIRDGDAADWPECNSRLMARQILKEIGE